MLKRKIELELDRFYASNGKKALLITGARQVGKTFIIREFGKRYRSFVEINFLEQVEARELFENAKNSSDLLLRLSAVTTVPLIPGETLIFLDEVQECREIVTAIKFLVEEGSYRYILSGSLLIISFMSAGLNAMAPGQEPDNNYAGTVTPSRGREKHNSRGSV